MAAIPGSVPLTGKVAPTDTTDTFATHMDIYGEGGYMAVADTAARNLITEDRRKLGMAVCTTTDNKIYTLTTEPGGATTIDANWTEFSSGGVADWQTVMDEGSTASVNAPVELEAYSIEMETGHGGGQIRFDTNGEGAPIIAHTVHSDIALMVEGGVGDITLNTADGDILFNNTRAVQTLEVTLSPLDIALMSIGTNKELIPAPGPDKAIVVLSCYSYINYIAPAWNNVAIMLQYDGALSQFGQTTSINVTADTGRAVYTDLGGYWTTNSKLEATVTAPGTGGSSVKLYLTYIIIDT